MGVLSNQLKRILGDEIELTESEVKSEELKKDYLSKIHNKTKVKKINKMDLKYIKKLFVDTFEFENNTKLIINKENAPIYDLIAKYFAKDEAFNKSAIPKNVPSLEKGLLIIGGYGCGKTSMLKAYHKMGYKLLPDSFLWFIYKSCLSLVSEYEGLSTQEGKDDFNTKYYNATEILFDDLGAEKDASNFGKRNLIQEILEERYSNKKKTHATTNLSLLEIKQRYGDRLYDRLQQMFNIIEMKGNSFRK